MCCQFIGQVIVITIIIIVVIKSEFIIAITTTAIAIIISIRLANLAIIATNCSIVFSFIVIIIEYQLVVAIITIVIHPLQFLLPIVKLHSMLNSWVILYSFTLTIWQSAIIVEQFDLLMQLR